ncbi:methyl-accepting chemotaxis protein [Rhizobium sp. LjRoot254]|uniref:methyl-accepting chemotaxis protein n=1 Tax=Rhizobium sp. LjRoot254 TaxID=3342297 RepID=UPI003ECEECC9
MFFDRFLSRFKIQTKVFLFVIPFVLSMLAVGLTGLYASGLLVGRMEISNTVMTSLRGFKDVYASMNRFLSNVSDETYQDAKHRAAEQLAALEATAASLDTEAGVDQLRQAVEEAKGISANIESMWQLHEAEVKSLAEVNSILDEMVKMQEETQRKITALANAGSRKANKNKSSLQKAYALDLAADMVNRMSFDFQKESEPARKLEALKKYAVELDTTMKTVKVLLPKDKASAGSAFEASARPLLDAMMKNDGGASALESASGQFFKLRASASLFKEISGMMTREAIKTIKATDAEISKAEAIAGRMRYVNQNHATIRILASKLIYAPSAETLEGVKQSVYMYEIEIERVAKGTKEDPYFTALPEKTAAMNASLMSAGTQIVKNSADRNAKFADAAARIDRTWQLLSDFAALQKENAGHERKEANTISIGATALGILIALLAGIGMVFTFKRPIGQITATMRRLADGMLDTGISGDRRSDEIGDMARALTVFKENALAKVSMEEQADDERQAAETERLRNERERQEINRQVEFAVEALAMALSELAHGRLDTSIDTPFSGNLDKLRHDFNTSVVGLRDTLAEILSSSSMIQDNGRQMHEAANDLSKRTEQQAAALEEAAASIEEITATVKTSTERTGEAQKIVFYAKQKADNSSEIVQNAISAMMRIKDASNKIGQIIGVIDSIAFQTNLLALNAGVEAARAGETGKGFAVVAHEVRELAQRSAKAAKEIGSLIVNATDEVATGARFVEETGSALIEISNQIVDLSGHVDLIATSAREQSVSLEEVNASVNAMDQMTQRNAAMVEETNAATRRLAEEADVLMELVGRFHLDADGNRREAA